MFLPPSPPEISGFPQRGRSWQTPAKGDTKSLSQIFSGDNEQKEQSFTHGKYDFHLKFRKLCRIVVDKSIMVFQKIVTEGKQNHGACLNIKDKARVLRKNMTNVEKKLWRRLRRNQLNGMYFRRQHPFGIYILDFYYFEANLAIEIDGKIHLAKKEYDKERTEYLVSSGLQVLRFKNEDVENRLEWVIDTINEYLP